MNQKTFSTSFLPHGVFRLSCRVAMVALVVWFGLIAEIRPR